MFHNNEIVFLTSKASGKNVRLSPPGNTVAMDGNGGDGKFARWRVHAVGSSVSFEACALPGKFMRVEPNGSLNAGGGKGGPLTLFNVSTVGGGVICLSSAKGHGNVGILPTGVAKNGKQTGTGPHGQFVIKRPDPFPELKQGAVVHLTTASKKNLKSVNGVVDGNGGTGPFARWIVHRVGANQVRFQSQKDSKYLRIQNDNVNGSGGTGPLSLFNIVRHANGMYSFQFQGGGYLGVLPSGACKQATKTGTGPHGQFRVSFAA
jgi:hypothetical protein